MADTNKYSVMYRLNLRFVINQQDVIQISAGDIVSVSINNRYDDKTYPMFRLRLYSDLSVLQSLTDNPDGIELRGSFDGGIYRMVENTKTPILVKPTQSIQISMKGYIEYKNTPTSKMDQYANGLPITIDNALYANNKVPIEIYCYDEHTVHHMKDQSQAVYHDMTIPSIINAMLNRCNIQKKQVDPIQNQIKFNQVLVPNLSMLDALSFFDLIYGLYPKGGMVFGGLDKLYICDLASSNGTVPLPIYVHSYKNNSDMSGMMYAGNDYFMQTEFASVSILSESDIERVLQSERIVSVNVNTLEQSEVDLPFYNESKKQIDQNLITEDAIGNISPQLLLHKTTNPYYASMAAARINEKITKVDVSGVGFDIAKITPNTRYNLIFASPIRGMNMADCYRASYVTHVLVPSGNDMFTAETTMTLCRN